MAFEKGADLITWDLAEGRSGAIAEDLPGDRGAGCGEAGRGVTPGTPACPHGRDQWLTVLAPCLRQARGWHVPPRWSASDWFEELRAEGAVAAWEAARDFDPGRGIPLWAFVRRRVLFHLLHHYRKEWAHAVRLHPEGRPLAAESDPGPRPESDAAEVMEVLAKLGQEDLQIIKSLFWNNRSEAEVAALLGISQQAVSKRKLAILGRLRRLLSPPEAAAVNLVVSVRLRVNKRIVEQ